MLEQSLPFFNSLGVHLTAERIYSTLLLRAANFVEDRCPPTPIEMGNPMTVQQCLRMGEQISFLLMFGGRKAVALFSLAFYPQ